MKLTIGEIIKKLYILVFYRNDTQLLTYPGKKDRDYFILQAVLGTIVVNLLFTVFLTGIFIYFDTPDSIMGYVPILPNIAGIFLIFTGIITEKIRNIKRVVIVLNFISKTFIVSIVWLPLLFNKSFAPYIMIACAFIGFLANAIMGVLINSWFIDTVDENIRGRYMSVRQVFPLLITATLPIITARFLDTSPNEYFAFCVIFSVGWIASFFESYSLFKVTSPKKEEHEYVKYKFIELFKKPLKNKAFMKFIILQILFHLIWNISMSFATVYNIKYMGISYTFINLMMAMSAIGQMIIYPQMGKAMDKYGTKFIMRFAFIFFMINSLLYFFMMENTSYLLFFIVNINMAILSPAWVLSTFNGRFEVIPKKGRTMYDGFFTTVLGVSIFLGPTIGNILRKIIVNKDITSMAYPEFRLLFLITFIGLFVLNIVLLIKSKKQSNFKNEKELINSVFHRKIFK